MGRITEWDDLEDENALLVVGTIARLLGQLERQCDNPALIGIAHIYRTDALAGDYEHLMETSHRYAYEHLRETLNVPESRP